MTKKLLYLASPYSDTDFAIRQERFQQTVKYAAQISREWMVFAPVVHSAPLAEQGGLPISWNFWQELDRRLLLACDVFGVLMLDGWSESEGVQAELALAKERGIPVIMFDTTTSDEYPSPDAQQVEVARQEATNGEGSLIDEILNPPRW